MKNKQSKLFNEVAELILDSPDCKQEIIWLLKKYFKDENELSDTYNDLINSCDCGDGSGVLKEHCDCIDLND